MKIYIESLGCAKNQVDSEILLTQALHKGYVRTEDPTEADLIVVNTCGFLQSACEEAIDNILEMAALKQAGQIKKILVTGCMAQRYMRK